MSCLMYFSNLLGNLMWSKHFEVAAEQGHKKSRSCPLLLHEVIVQEVGCIHTCQLSRSKGFNLLRSWMSGNGKFSLSMHFDSSVPLNEAHSGNTLEAAVTQLCPAWVTAQRKGSVVSGSAGRPPPPWPKHLGGNTTCQRLGGHTWHKQKWPLARPPWNPHPR